MTDDDLAVSRAQQMLASGSRDKAIELLREVLDRNPRHGAANNLVGFAMLQDGQLEDAELWFHRAIEAAPENPAYRENLSLAQGIKKQGAHTETLRAALTLEPKQPELWHRLAQAEAAASRLDAAVGTLYEGLSHCPEHPNLLHLLAGYLHRAGRLTQAATHYQHCVRVAPHRIEAWIDLSSTYLRLSNGELAETSARTAVECAPGSARAATNLATVLYERRSFDEALAHLMRARELEPDHASIYNNLGMVYGACGNIDQAIASFRQALNRKPDYATARSNLMLTLLYSDQVSGEDIHREACTYAKQSVLSSVITHSNARDLNRRLRIGFVSGDFRRHVVGLFLLPLFVHRDRSQAEYFCYSLIDTPDPFTRMLQAHTDHWIDSRAFDDAQLAARVRADAIDILIDLSGHTSANRLAVFARRPAPVQATWLGYPGTTGAPGIDYRFTDDVLDPPGSEALSTETLVRLPCGFFCYRPPPDWGGLLMVKDLPAERNGHITFGAFNNLTKFSHSCFDAWAQILSQVPGSRFISRAKPFDIAAERERFIQKFADRGIDASRITPLPYVPDPTEHLSIYHGIDIHLDSFPYSGGTTSCDALWMGVPTVSLHGDRTSARLGATVLERVGLRELIAYDPSQYVRIAVALANVAAKLSALRQGLRARFTASPLHDAQAFSRDFEAACRTIWGKWCAR